MIASFLAAYPRIQVEIDVANHPVDLTRREADLALRASNTPGDHLIGREAGDLRYAIYGAASHQHATLEDALAQLPWLGFDDSIAHYEVARWLQARTGHATPRVRFSSIAPMVQAVAEGLGIAILPLFAADRNPALQRLGAVLDQPRMNLWILTHREMRGNPRVIALSRHLARNVPRVLAERQATDA